MHGTAFYEHAHEDDKQDTHAYDGVPVFGDPVGDSLQCLLVQEEILETYQWSFGVNSATLEEYVAIALKS